MKLRTIWTIPAMTLAERLRRTKDETAQIISAHLPKRIKYWVTMQQIALATRNHSNIMGATTEEILHKLDRPEHTN